MVVISRYDSQSQCLTSRRRPVFKLYPNVIIAFCLILPTVATTREIDTSICDVLGIAIVYFDAL